MNAQMAQVVCVRPDVFVTLKKLSHLEVSHWGLYFRKAAACGG